MTLVPGAWLVLGSLVWLPAQAAVADYDSELSAGRLPSVELSLVDDYVAFELGLFAALTSPSTDEPALADGLLADLMDTSPLALRRSFSDGRTPTGWDLVQAQAQAGLAARRPELAAMLTEVTELLSPDVWQVAQGTQRLAELCRAAPHERVVAALVYQSAERLAPFPQYHDAMDEVLRVAFAALDASGDEAVGVRHLLELSSLRVAAGSAGRAVTDVDLEHWSAAAATAPDEWQASLVELTGLVLRARQGDVAQQAVAREELAAFSGQTPFNELALRAGEQLTRRWLTQGELSRALGWCALVEREGGSPEQLAGLRLIMVRDGQTLLHDQPAAVLDQLDAQLMRSLKDLGATPLAPALTWAAAVLADARERPDEASSLLMASAAATLSGAEPVPPLSPRSEWWVPLGDAAAGHLRPLEFSRAACWQLAEQAVLAERWEDVLRYGAYPAPAEGCGNVIMEAERHGLRRRALALDGLGRHGEALDVRGELLLSAGYNDITRALSALIDEALLHDEVEGLQSWIGRSGPTPDGRLEKAALFLEFRLALRAGARDDALRSGAELRQRWPGDDLLSRLVTQHLDEQG